MSYQDTKNSLPNTIFSATILSFKIVEKKLCGFHMLTFQLEKHSLHLLHVYFLFLNKWCFAVVDLYLSIWTQCSLETQMFEKILNKSFI